MIVTLKTLQEDTFTVEIDPSQTVRKFKEKIEKVKGHEFPAKNMKLMYAGKFLVDSNRVCDYNVEEKKFVIVVVKKPKTVVKEEEPESSSSSSRERIPFMNGRRGGNDQDFLCANHEQLVHHITELGFSRNDVEAALRASYNNPDRAVEYLISVSIRT
ncbi:UV excision repair protein RAD23 homolog B-like [Stegodyphus dumicola]|uniref:UV excision repair protein RAD23 homolog B-like n=1 Tax=Stegodyphus dumicola TaxID=202533 RepID=UPI0015AAAC07|nr:UV excision repair protein RAD23 homolog B-like [Stegodyphus dumicola]